MYDKQLYTVCQWYKILICCCNILYDVLVRLHYIYRSLERFIQKEIMWAKTIYILDLRFRYHSNYLWVICFLRIYGSYLNTPSPSRNFFFITVTTQCRNLLEYCFCGMYHTIWKLQRGKRFLRKIPWGILI